jgi:hypothetical protein
LLFFLLQIDRAEAYISASTLATKASHRSPYAGQGRQIEQIRLANGHMSD